MASHRGPSPCSKASQLRPCIEHQQNPGTWRDGEVSARAKANALGPRDTGGRDERAVQQSQGEEALRGACQVGDRGVKWDRILRQSRLESSGSDASVRGAIEAVASEQDGRLQGGPEGVGARVGGVGLGRCVCFDLTTSTGTRVPRERREDVTDMTCDDGQKTQWLRWSRSSPRTKWWSKGALFC